MKENSNNNMTTKKKPVQKLTLIRRIVASVSRWGFNAKTAYKNYMSRRPHRSFRRTRRRDYVRSLKLPGYWAFSLYVLKFLRQNKKIFLLLALAYAVISAVMVGVASQDTYTTLTDTLKQTSGDLFKGNFGQLGQASLLLLTIASGGISQSLTEGQQIYAGLIALLTWLTTVWLARNILAGKRVKLRDGLYNASAPILSTFLVALVLIIQLLPLAIALIGYSAAAATGLLNGGVEAMLFWIVAGLLTILSLYWITSTIIALVVVTLPGMYPFVAIKTAGDMVIGRRVRILLRFLWMALGVGIAWLIVMIPVIIFDSWIKGLWPAIQWLPTIPVVTLALSSMTIVWAAVYVYLLYRKVVADDADPA